MESAPRGAPHLGPGHPPHQNHGGLALHLRCLEASDFGVLHPLRGVLDRERGWVGVPVVPGGLGAVAVRSVQVIHQRVLVGSYDRRFPAGVRGLPTRFPVRRAGTIMEEYHEISSLYTAGWSPAAGEARAGGGGVLLAALAR